MNDRKWLFVCPRMPWPIINGRWLRVYHLARTLVSLGDHVDLLSFDGDSEGVEAYGNAGVGIAELLPGRHCPKGPGRCRLATHAYDPDFARAVERHAGEYDATVLEGQTVLQYSREANRSGTVISEMVDDPVLEARRKLFRNPAPVRLARRMKFLLGEPNYERYCMEHVNCAVFVTSDDADSFSRRVDGTPTAVIPNGVDAEFFAPPEDAEPRDQNRLVFLGHMSHPPNEDAAEFLARDILPYVQLRRPQVRVTIVGADVTDRVASLASERVEVTGRVEDVRPYLWSAGAVVLPMRIGTGIKNKILEAWAAGAAVVTTPRALQGLPEDAHSALAVAQGAKTIGQQALRILRSRATQESMGAAGRRIVREHFTWPAAANKLRALTGQYQPQYTAEKTQCH
ncbi:MAG: glycosyltransferase family 4 protein [Phycisphaerae bacterium]